MVKKNGEGKGGRQGPPETENLLCGRGQQRCNEDRDRHQPGVMLHQLREEGLRQRMEHEITVEKQILCLTLLVWFIPLFLLFVAAQTLTWKMQNSPTAHCMLFLTTRYTRMTAADGVAVRLRDKSWWNMRFCHLPSVQTRWGCNGRVCTRQNSLRFLPLACVWSMLISFCQDSFLHVERTKGRA